MTNPDLVGLAGAIADASRAAMLDALMDGRAHSMGELAKRAHVTPPTASEHVARLVDAKLARVRRGADGRTREVTLAGPRAARLLERMGAFAQPNGRPTGELRFARTCYDHLAGVLGVRVIDALTARGWIAARDGAIVAERGVLAWLGEHRVELHGRRPLVRACVDWSERVPHLAGQIGAAIASVAFAEHWIVRARDSRIVRVTARGRNALIRELGVEI
jgi:DNA-binding transcriptional ArsR family regulator